jgi:hypothetical protein
MVFLSFRIWIISSLPRVLKRKCGLATQLFKVVVSCAQQLRFIRYILLLVNDSAASVLLVLPYKHFLTILPMKKAIGLLAILVGFALLVLLAWLFSGENAGTFVKFKVTQEAAGYCEANGQQQSGLYTFAGCQQQFPNWTRWCDVNGNCQTNGNQLGLCARTQQETVYSALPNGNDCQGAGDNKFYSNCVFKPGIVPPWTCSGGQQPPPVPSAPGGSSGDPDLGLCAKTSTSVTSYIGGITFDLCQHESAGGRFRVDFYPDCDKGPGSPPWQCGSSLQQGTITN